jgi:hypothetical protein
VVAAARNSAQSSRARAAAPVGDKMKRAAIALAGAVALGGCTILPDVTYHYYLPKSATTLAVTQALTCLANNSGPRIVTTVSAPTTSYTADVKAGAQDLPISAFKAPLSDTDAGIGFYDDGRLKSINTATTGQGETVLKAAIAMGTAIAPLAAMHGFVEAAGPPPPSACDILKKAGFDTGKTATLSYSMVVSFDGMQEGANYIVNPPPAPAIVVNDIELYAQLQRYLPTVIVAVGERSLAPLVVTNGENREAFNLLLRRTANVRLDFFVCDACTPPTDEKPNKNWAGNAVWILSARTTVEAPNDTKVTVVVPKGEPFGNSKTGMTLSEAGAIESLEYGSQTGAAGVMNVVSGVATAVTPASAPATPTEKPTTASGGN